ncbi:Uncharacterised protein [Salmonella enterica subsp. enterica serovar Bovismorbificans]|uniref:Uncharacterized protein n=1 Tax=Salmonella enterica subsp. enterica serovar Bovismorbificans TaxID=58097 RepID=A0A655C4T6_SALET|nr:Uncharacterised protein [Salmonella enterica subsp. enterica serovar Bovismorbificans]
MLLHGAFDNRQPQPGAARLAVARLISAIERTEDLLAVFRADARPVVIDRDRNTVFIHREADFNLRM